MFTLGFIFMVNDSQELSVIFVPLVLPEQTPMVEVFGNTSGWVGVTQTCHIQITDISVLSSRRCAVNCGPGSA